MIVRGSVTVALTVGATVVGVQADNGGGRAAERDSSGLAGDWSEDDLWRDAITSDGGAAGGCDGDEEVDAVTHQGDGDDGVFGVAGVDGENAGASASGGRCERYGDGAGLILGEGGAGAGLSCVNRALGDRLLWRKG